MIELFELALTSFWHFVGTILIIAVFPAVIFDGVVDIIKASKSKKK